MTMLTAPAFRNDAGFIFQPVIGHGIIGIDKDGAVAKIADTYQYVWRKGHTFRDMATVSPVAVAFMDGDETVIVDGFGHESRISGPYRLAMVAAVLDSLNGHV